MGPIIRKSEDPHDGGGGKMGPRGSGRRNEMRYPSAPGPLPRPIKRVSKQPHKGV